MYTCVCGGVHTNISVWMLNPCDFAQIMCKKQTDNSFTDVICPFPSFEMRMVNPLYCCGNASHTNIGLI